MKIEEPLENILENLPRDQILALVQNEKVASHILDTIVRKHLHDEEILKTLLRHPAVSSSTLSFIARHASPSLAETIAQDKTLLGRFTEIREALLSNPSLGIEMKDLIQEKDANDQAAATKEQEAKEKERKKDLYTTIKGLSTGQRLALAKKGNKDVRMILIRDPNEMIALEVVSSPRITDAEIVQISGMKDVSEKVLRAIANNRRYRSNKAIVLTLLHNPKTPVSISLGLGIPRLADKELVGLSKNRNIPGVVARAAAVVLEKRKKPPSQPGKGH
jgi:hypothetical protein